MNRELTLEESEAMLNNPVTFLKGEYADLARALSELSDITLADFEGEAPDINAEMADIQVLKPRTRNLSIITIAGALVVSAALGAAALTGYAPAPVVKFAKATLKTITNSVTRAIKSVLIEEDEGSTRITPPSSLQAQQPDQNTNQNTNEQSVPQSSLEASPQTHQASAQSQPNSPNSPHSIPDPKPTTGVRDTSPLPATPNPVNKVPEVKPSSKGEEIKNSEGSEVKSENKTEVKTNEKVSTSTNVSESKSTEVKAVETKASEVKASSEVKKSEPSPFKKSNSETTKTSSSELSKSPESKD